MVENWLEMVIKRPFVSRKFWFAVSINSRSNVSIELEKYCYTYFRKQIVSTCLRTLPISKRKATKE